MSKVSEYTNIDLETEIIKVKKIKEEYEALIKDLKKKQLEYQNLVDTLKYIKDGLLNGKLNKKQIKAFIKLCGQRGD